MTGRAEQVFSNALTLPIDEAIMFYNIQREDLGYEFASEEKLQ